ncbi:MAG: DNA polymerase III subunit gamma/tau, partial [Treponema sp.]|nr:DNA polymerase III subunit gamma/tau [Treponema sp.]
DEVLFPPNSARYKIYIIDEVHMLSTNAFNALLKTIEEPPPYVIFIFATTELQKVPATIKSRCQQFNFRLVAIEKIKSLLEGAVKNLGITADDESLYWIARESTGSVRDAYTLFDQIASFSDGNITYEKIRAKLGLVGLDQLNELFLLCTKNQTEDVLLSLDNYFQSGISFEQLIIQSTNYLRSLLLIKNGVTKEALLGNSLERFEKEVVASWNVVQVERALSIFLQLYRDIRYSLSPRYEIELAFSKLSWLSEYVSPKEVKYAIDEVRPLLSSSASAMASVNEMANASLPTPTQTSAMSRTLQNSTTMQVKSASEDITPNASAMSHISSISNESEHLKADTDNVISSVNSIAPHAINDINEFRPIFLKEISKKDNMLSVLLESINEWTLSENALTIFVVSQYQKNQLEKKSMLLSTTASSICNKHLQFCVEIKKVEPKSEEQIELPESVKIFQEEFSGSIVAGKI